MDLNLGESIRLARNWDLAHLEKHIFAFIILAMFSEIDGENNSE